MWCLILQTYHVLSTGQRIHQTEREPHYLTHIGFLGATLAGGVRLKAPNEHTSKVEASNKSRPSPSPFMCWESVACTLCWTRQVNKQMNLTLLSWYQYPTQVTQVVIIPQWTKWIAHPCSHQNVSWEALQILQKIHEALFYVAKNFFIYTIFYDMHLRMVCNCHFCGRQVSRGMFYREGCSCVFLFTLILQHNSFTIVSRPQRNS